MKPKLLIILGPTGVGKSEVAIEAAGAVGGEIINADSQQVYRAMDIGTGKPPIAQREKIPHHLIDIVDPDEDFDAARFRRTALESAREIWSRGKRVILCGGTGLYIRALTRGLFAGPPKDPEIRRRLEGEARRGGLAILYERLRRADPDATTWIHPNDRQRIIRALEVFSTTGRPISQWQKEHGFQENPFETLKIGLNREREELYALIDRRCDEMIAAGFVDEVKGLLEKGYSPDLKALQSVGYRQMGLYLRGSMELEAAVLEMKRETHHLAKRQLTWFRSDPEIRWFHPQKERQGVLKACRKFFEYD